MKRRTVLLVLSLASRLWAWQNPVLILQGSWGCMLNLEISAQSGVAGIADYRRIDFPGGVAVGEPGDPVLPARVLLVALPQGAVPRVTVESGEVETLSDLRLLPVPQLTDDPQNPERYEEGERYRSEDLYPNRLWDEEIVQMGDLRLLRLTVYPVRYRPSSRVVEITKTLAIRVDFLGGEAPVRTQGVDDVLLSQLANGAQVRGWPRAEPKKTVPRLSRSLQTGNWYKLPITQEGVYRITGSWLRSQGIDPASIDPATVKIFHNGGRELPHSLSLARPDSLIELPVLMQGMEDGRWNDADALLFYGVGVSGVHLEGSLIRHHFHRYDTQNTVWLVFGDGVAGKRVETLVRPDASGAQVVTQGQDLAFFEEDLLNLAQGGLKWYAREFFVGAATQSVDPGFHHPVPNTTMQFRFAMAGLDNGTHRFTARLGGQTVASLTVYGNADTQIAAAWNGDPGAEPFALALTYLYSGSSTNPHAYLDWVEVGYIKTLQADDGYLRVFTPATTGLSDCRLSGFTATPTVWDVTDLGAISALTPQAEGADWSVVVDNAPGLPRRLAAFETGALLTPTSIQAASAPALREDLSGAQMVILTHADFREAADRLAEHRRTESGLTVKVVDISEVFDSFSAGLYDPVAIRDFLKFARDRWAVPPEYVLLMGDGDYDYRNILSDADKNWIPPYENDGRSNNGSRASDDFYAYLEGNDDVMDVAIGRLPVRSATEASAVVEKIIRYETDPDWGDWRQGVTLVGDDEKAGGGVGNEIDHIIASERLADEVVHPQFEVKKIFLTEYPTEVTGDGLRKPMAKQALLDQFNRGTLWVNYIGHGNNKLWAHEWIFHRDYDDNALNNPRRLPLIFAATCSFGWYDLLDEQSFSEVLVNAGDHGAIAVISASRLCSAPYNEALNATFTGLVLGGQGSAPRLGKALQLAKAVSGSTTNNEMYHLFGDPAMRLALPRHEAVITHISPDTLKALGVVEVEGELRYNGALWSDFQGQVALTVRDVRRERTYVTEAGSELQYDLAGNALFRGEAQVSGGLFHTAFVVPKDISYGEVGGRISCYAWNDTTDADGYADSLVLGGTANVTDTQGPEVDLYFSGREDFLDGDMVPAPVELVAAVTDDKTGVNITGEIGHKLLVTVDDGEVLDATEVFRYDAGSYLAGKVVYPLEGLAEGRHRLHVKAWDNANNSGEARLDFEVVPQGKLRIEEVLNYPNPMSQSTDFTFRLSHDARVEIKIYTVSGRMIRHLEGIQGEAGYNQVGWDGLDSVGDRPANGVYLYKVMARSLWDDGASSKSEALGRLMIFR